MIAGFLYGTSPKDGLPTHDRSTPVQFGHGDVVQWHLSRSYGDARRYLGASLRDGTLVFVVRSQVPEPERTRLDGIARRLRRGTAFSGSRRSMEFQRSEEDVR